MRATEIIQKKRMGKELSESELKLWLDAYLNDEVTDYQMSAWLMAVCFQGMTSSECAAWTRLMWKSGETMPRSEQKSFWVDKHSTGGVGDKTSLLLVPIVIAASQRIWGKGQVKIPMISGRGLGHTGGTLDKLQSVSGYQTEKGMEEALELLEKNDFFMIGQSEEIAPADKKIYALRDATSTVESIPLIVSSILSKKLSENLDGIVFDVKAGNAAFMKSKEHAVKLAKALVEISKANGVQASASVTAMDEPLGRKIGNFLEVEECWEFINGVQERKLKDLVIELASQMLFLAAKGTLSVSECVSEITKELSSEEAKNIFKMMFVSQGGNWEFFQKALHQLPTGYSEVEVRAPHSGYIESVDALSLALWVQEQGGGRKKTSDSIDPWIGIKDLKKQGETVAEGEKVCSIIIHDKNSHLQRDPEIISRAFSIGKIKPQENPLILERMV